MKFVEALQKIDLEKAKAQIGEIRDWADGKYKKISDGEWVKVTETKAGVKEKTVAQSGMKKVIAVELEKHYASYRKVVDDFEKNWLSANQLSRDALSRVQNKVRLQRDQVESETIKEAYENYSKARTDLNDDLQDVMNSQEIKAKKDREEKAGKREVGIDDEVFNSKMDSISSLFQDINKLPSFTTADKALGKPVVENYWLNTDTTFKNIYSYNSDDATELGKKEDKSWSDPVEARWEEMRNSGKYEFTQSPKSSSQYLVDKKENKVYRKSDHWGRCASCVWDFDGTHNYGIGVSHIDDFTRNKGAGWANPDKMNTSQVNNKKVLSILKKYIKDDTMYLDEKANKKVKQVLERVISDLKNTAMLDDKTLTKIKKQNKELFAL